MINERKAFNLLSLIVSSLIVSSCAIRDLGKNNEMIDENYGIYRGQVSGVDQGSNVVVGLFKRDGKKLTYAGIRSVSPGDRINMLVRDKDASYTVMAYLDSNGDFAYQSDESKSAARIDDPEIHWASDRDKDLDCPDYESMKIEQIDLTGKEKLDWPRKAPEIRNFLETISLDDDERFSDENVKLGLWQPFVFETEIGYGLYVLKDFDPTKNSIVLVHGISDSPRVFKSVVEAIEAIPDDYQVLMFHYPSAVSLDYTSYILSAALNEVIRRSQIPQLDIIAHSMGGLVSKGMILQSSAELRQSMRLFISIATPYGGHAGAQAGLDWSPNVARVWCAMAPDSAYLKKIGKLDLRDLSKGPRHHLIYTYSHERDGTREDDDGVVSVDSQLTKSAKDNATARYGIADNHVGAVSNPCTFELVKAILQDGSTVARVPGCGADDVSPDSAPAD